MAKHEYEDISPDRTKDLLETVVSDTIDPLGTGDLPAPPNYVTIVDENEATQGDNKEETEVFKNEYTQTMERNEKLERENASYRLKIVELENQLGSGTLFL